MSKTNKFLFLASLFLICANVLVLQIAMTRLLSIIHFYHLAFFSISMAMLGLTGGAIAVYLLEKRYGKLDLGVWLPRACNLTAWLTLLSLAVVTSVKVKSLAAMLLLVAGMLPPYLAAGMVVSLALTRSPVRVGITYGADLVGAASGCLLALLVLNTLSPVNAIIITVIGALLAGAGFATAASRRPGTIFVGVLLVVGMLMVFQSQAPLYQLIAQKKVESDLLPITFRDSNSFSYITLVDEMKQPPSYWGQAKDAPMSDEYQRFLQIDGLAGSPLHRFPGTYEGMSFLRYDITNFAYAIRSQGSAAIIGVGGGRDIASARHFGFKDVTAVELNPITVNLLTKIEPYASYTHVGLDPNVKLHIDDGRSWFARTNQKFDLIQMSMVDTWAATGAGNFTLSENGLYTLEGWQHFLGALRPNGVFTVSRWYAPGNVDETGRMIALAVATLHSLGVTNAKQHIYVAAVDNLATLVLSPQELSASDIAQLDAEVAARGYKVLVHPLHSASSSLLGAIVSAKDHAELLAITSAQSLDLTPTTDNRPFFFNQLKLGSVFEFAQRDTAVSRSDGVVEGNLIATRALLAIVAISTVFVIGLLVAPASGALAGVKKSLSLAGSNYFALIGLAFMFVEMGLIQRMSVFLGHPVYGLAIVLFSIILATGIGSLFSDRVKLNAAALGLWIGALVVLLVALALLGPRLVAHFESASLLVRALVTVLHVAPPALLMGLAFPVGLRLTMAVDERPGPWFWGMNGAAGVLASGLAVLTSMAWGITTTLLIGAGLYLLLLWPTKRLLKLQP